MDEKDDDVLQPKAKRPCLTAIDSDTNAMMKRPTDIKSLIGDCLTLVTDYLDANALMFLIWTGDKSFLNTVFRVAKRFVVNELPLTCITWPAIIPHFRQLTTLSVNYNPDRFRLCGDQFEINKTDLCSLPASITSLRLSNVNIYFSVLSDLPLYSVKAPFLHNLQIVRLHRVRLTHWNEPSFFQGVIFGNQLRHLKISGDTSSHHQQAFFDMVPSTLSSLSITCCTPSVDMSNTSLTKLSACIHLDSSTSVKLPSTLTTLSLFEDSSCDDILAVPSLPPFLTKLKIECSETHLGSVITQWHDNHLPSTSVKTIVLMIHDNKSGGFNLLSSHAKALCTIFPEADRLTVSGVQFKRRTIHWTPKCDHSAMDDWFADICPFDAYLAWDVHSIWAWTDRIYFPK